MQPRMQVVELSKNIDYSVCNDKVLIIS